LNKQKEERTRIQSELEKKVQDSEVSKSALKEIVSAAQEKRQKD
jgi:hypothetical protein